MKFTNIPLKLTQLSWGAVTVAISYLGVDNSIERAAAASMNLDVSGDAIPMIQISQNAAQSSDQELMNQGNMLISAEDLLMLKD